MMNYGQFLGESKKSHGFVASAAPVSAVKPTLYQESSRNDGRRRIIVQ